MIWLTNKSLLTKQVCLSCFLFPLYKQFGFGCFQQVETVPCEQSLSGLLEPAILLTALLSLSYFPQLDPEMLSYLYIYLCFFVEGCLLWSSFLSFTFCLWSLMWAISQELSTAKLSPEHQGRDNRNVPFWSLFFFLKKKKPRQRQRQNSVALSSQKSLTPNAGSHIAAISTYTQAQGYKGDNSSLRSIPIGVSTSISWLQLFTAQLENTQWERFGFPWWR